MKKFLADFIRRGSMWAWGGPVIVCIVWLCLEKAGQIESLGVGTVALGVVSSTFMAFIAAGITVVHNMEQLPKGMAALIQMAALYVDYLGIYLLNGWLPIRSIGYFTVIFVIGFGIIWAIIYLSTRIAVERINSQLNK